MDGFDDLLKQSSLRALEENPFEDPFAKPRSHSPDPWTSYLRSSDLPAQEFGSSTSTFEPFEQEESTTPTTNSHEVRASSPVDAPADPLDLANANLSDEEQEQASLITSPRTSGFRESIENEPPTPSSSGFRESIEHAEHAEHARPPPITTSSSSSSSASPPSPKSPTTPSLNVASPTFASPTSFSPPTSARLPQRQTSYHSSSFSQSTPKTDPPRAVVSPLEQPQSSFDRSFTSLALGGESFNGWDGSQSAFVSSPPRKVAQEQDDEDDDDDDKPLRPRPVTSDPVSDCASSAICNTYANIIIDVAETTRVIEERRVAA